MATYYVSQQNGNDSNDGTSPSTAWQTFQKPFNAGMTTGGDRVYIGPGTYREAVVLNNSGEARTIATTGGLVRSSGVVTVTAANAGDFANFTAGKRVVIHGSTSGSFDGCFTITEQVDSSTFRYVQDTNWYADETSGGGTAGLIIDVVMDPDCRYLTNDKPGAVRLTRCDSNEKPQSGRVLDFNSKLYVHFRGYDDAAGPTWMIDGSLDTYVVYGSANQTLRQQVVANAIVGGKIAGYYVTFLRCYGNSLPLPYQIVPNCYCENSIVNQTTRPGTVFCSLIHGAEWLGGYQTLYGVYNVIALRSGFLGDSSAKQYSVYCGHFNAAYTSGSPKFFVYRDNTVDDEGPSTYDRSIETNGILINDDLDPINLDAVRNLSDWSAPAFANTTTYSIDLSSECLPAFTPTFPGLARGAAIRVVTTDGSGNVTVELQKYISGSWTTVRSKTRACSGLTAGDWNIFEFDTGSGDRCITKAASTWRLRVTHDGSGTGTTISTGTAGSRTAIAYRLFVTCSYLPDKDFNGRWRPYRTYPDNWKNMMGPWDIPKVEQTYTSGEYYSDDPGLKISTPGDFQVPLATKGGVTYTVTVWCKQVNCNSARCPKLVAWGNGITEQTDTKTYDSSWEQLSVSFTPAQDGIVIITFRHMDYDSSSYSLWSDMGVAES